MSTTVDPRYQVTGRAPGRTTYPYYDGAVLGLPGFWSPVCFAHEVRADRPMAATIRGHGLILQRDGDGRPRALEDRCPHRGVPLSIGSCEFAGTVSCRYHGWTFDLADGGLRAALTDGADSPIVGQRAVAVPTYPAVEAAGLVWVYLDGDDPPPISDQLPEVLMDPEVLVLGRWQEVDADWRHGVENGFDEGHAKFLHRNSLWKFFRYVAAWSKIKITADESGRWLTRTVTEVGFETRYPGLGTWPPPRRRWERYEGGGSSNRTPPVVSVALPGMLRIHWEEHPLGTFDFWELWVPTEANRYRYVQLLTQQATGVARWRTRLVYEAFMRWVYHHRFHEDDLVVVQTMQTPPEVLYRPDRSISAWRKLVEDYLASRDADVVPSSGGRGTS